MMAATCPSVMKLSAYLSSDALDTLFAQPFESPGVAVTEVPREALDLAFWSDLAGLPDRSFGPCGHGHAAPVVDASPLRL